MEKKRQKHKEVVRWSEKEKALITDAIHAMTIRRGIPLPYKRGTLVSLLREAQASLLPKERHRNLAVVSQFQWIEDTILDRMTSPPSNKPEEPVTPTAPTVEEKKEELLDLMAEALSGLFLESDVGQKLIHKMREKIQKKLLDEASKPGFVEEVSVASVKTPTPQKIKLPRLGVAGGDSRLFTILEDEFEGILDIRCLDADQLKKSGGATRLKFCDKVLVLTGYLSHSASDNVKRVTQKWELFGDRSPEKVSAKIRNMFQLKETSEAA